VTVVPSAPPTAPAATAGSGSSWLTATLFAAVITALVTVLLARRKHLEDERSRLTTIFSEASKAVAAYKEMPYAIRRRNHEDPAAERARLSQAMAAVQADLSFYLAWTAAESDTVGAEYATLVQHVRRVAGVACHDAWLDPAPTQDSDMNIPPTVVDLSALRPYEDAYAAAAKAHLDRYLTLQALGRRPGRHRAGSRGTTDDGAAARSSTSGPEAGPDPDEKARPGG
jgi:hypothetical protein